MTSIKQAMLEMLDSTADNVGLTEENKGWVRDFLENQTDESLTIMLKDKSARSTAIWADILRRKATELDPTLTLLGSLGVIKPGEEKGIGDRVMTLPSGRKVVLKDVTYGALSELHEIKVEGVAAMQRRGDAPETEAFTLGTFPASKARQEMFMGTAYGKALQGKYGNLHDFELPTPTAEQLKFALRRRQIRAELRKKGMDDNHIDRLFTALAENGVNLLNFNMDDLTITLAPAAPTAFDGALESFNKKAKKHSKKIK